MAGERRPVAPGMSVRQMNARTSLGRGQRCCEVKPCASNMRSPKELNVPAITWKEAVRVPVLSAEDNDSTYRRGELQMFCEGK